MSNENCVCDSDNRFCDFIGYCYSDSDADTDANAASDPNAFTVANGYALCDFTEHNAMDNDQR